MNDPSINNPHVEKMAAQLESISRDMRTLSEQIKEIHDQLNRDGGVREKVWRVEALVDQITGAIADAATLRNRVQAVEFDCKEVTKDLASMRQDQQWMYRLVIGAVILGMLAGGAQVYRYVLSDDRKDVPINGRVSR